MTGAFDPHDRGSWYFGQMSRQDATDLLMSERDSGIFLVRDSTTIIGDYVLCVSLPTASLHSSMPTCLLHLASHLPPFT
ncbi:Adapter molecule Crk [Chionoecetes opilio]|uniref:Adapter molecule Crk n=1 Tax=Chionoecetes opilio TaxID=41210 RepID=A0A8J5BY62_CHIOP|nr:Adapter molecule Crk [Chionoecetes opilio]